MTENLELWRRNPIDCIWDLIGNPAFHKHVAYGPEHIYADDKGGSRIFDEMWTGDWWWKTQVCVILGAVVAPVILASDKTALTQFGGDKKAWPVYLTIGNISKEVRRRPSSHSTVLLDTYLFQTSRVFWRVLIKLLDTVSSIVV